MESCSRCGATLDDAAMQAGRCPQCGKRIARSQLRKQEKPKEQPRETTTAAAHPSPPASPPAAQPHPAAQAIVEPTTTSPASPSLPEARTRKKTLDVAGGALQVRLHTDGTGAFYIYTGHKSYEFRNGPGCDVGHIVSVMVQKVMDYMDRHNTFVTTRTFFSVLCDAVDED